MLVSVKYATRNFAVLIRVFQRVSAGGSIVLKSYDGGRGAVPD